MRIVGIVMLVMSSFVALSQTQEEIDKLFKEGNYTKAVELVKQRDSIAEEKLKLEKKSLGLVKDSEWYYIRKQYRKSKELLSKAVSLNENNEQAKDLLAECDEKLAKDGDGSPFNKISFGIVGGMDFLAQNFGWHVGVGAKYGFYRDLVNVTLGLEYHQHLAYTNKYDIGKSGTDLLGSQLTVPVLVKFNLIDMSNSCRFYVGAGAEYGLRLTTRDYYTGTFRPSDSKALNSSTIAGLISLGIAMRHFDVGLYYKGYFKDIVVPPYFSYMENNRMGVNIAYYF